MAADPTRERLRAGRSETPIGGVRLAGRLPQGRGFIKKQSRVLGSYALVYVLGGRGHYSDETGLEADLVPGDLLLVLPEVPHRYGPPDDETWNQLFLVFDGPIFDLWRDAGLLVTLTPVTHCEPIGAWARAVDEVGDTVSAPGDGGALRAVCQVLTLLADAAAAQAPPDRAEERAWLDGAIALLESDVRRESPLAALAADLSMSYDGFRKRFRRLSGESPAQFRSKRAIDRACTLLVSTSMTNRQIAAELGYCDEFHFSHRFRQLTGQTPGQFRMSTPASGPS